MLSGAGRYGFAANDIDEPGLIVADTIVLEYVAVLATVGRKSITFLRS
jgi:hypothetical protein